MPLLRYSLNVLRLTLSIYATSLSHRYSSSFCKATLEDIFELNQDEQKIEQMREDVENYEEAVRKQAALAEQARLKEQAAKEQESKAKSIQDKQ